MSTEGLNGRVAAHSSREPPKSGRRGGGGGTRTAADYHNNNNISSLGYRDHSPPMETRGNYSNGSTPAAFRRNRDSADSWHGRDHHNGAAVDYSYNWRENNNNTVATTAAAATTTTTTTTRHSDDARRSINVAYGAGQRSRGVLHQRPRSYRDADHRARLPSHQQQQHYNQPLDRRRDQQQQERQEQQQQQQRQQQQQQKTSTQSRNSAAVSSNPSSPSNGNHQQTTRNQSRDRAEVVQLMSKLNVHAQEFTPSFARAENGLDSATLAFSEEHSPRNQADVYRLQQQQQQQRQQQRAYRRDDSRPNEVDDGARNADWKSRGDERNANAALRTGDPFGKRATAQMAGEAMAALRLKPPTEESKAQKESMEEQLLKGVYDCLICCARIRNTHTVWNCQSCFHIFHLRCVAEWAQKSLAAEQTTWRCPACQSETTDVPRNYYCFCGKQQNPQPARMSLPHSCTELCQKARSCPHRCNKLCHPGRCPPCRATVSRSCECGKTSRYVRCDSKIAIRCDQTCGKTLACGEHRCAKGCHSDECGPCELLKQVTCVCGRNTKQALCADPDTFRCDEPCRRPLACGHHECRKRCHRGDACDVCRLAEIKTCPCGRSPLPDDWNCSKEVPMCDAVCGRALAGCEHKCEAKCHSGECPPCPVLVKGRRCRCGAMMDEAECGLKVVVCRRRCNKKKNCGRHKCLDECCDKEFHICDLICGKKLSCGLHNCSIVCHKGACPKCDNVSFDELRCDCGFSVVYPPIPCNTAPPECLQLCGRTHRCSHPVTHPCHSEPTCPPCTSLTEKRCHGGHELRRNIPCHLENVSCGRPCGKPLVCGRHFCKKNCHAGECPTACEQPCQRQRECGHLCKLPCHDVCPQSTCFTQFEVSCACGRITEPRSCHEFQQAISNVVQQKIRRGEEVNLAKDLMKRAKGFLKCVERCAREERNRRLAEALQIDNPDKPVFTAAVYSDFVKDEARKNWHFALKVVNKLNELVELAKSSPQASRVLIFEPMPRDQRRFVYELLEVYRCSGQSYDQEPKRNVVVTAYKEMSVVPTTTLANAIGIVNPIPLRKL